MLNDIQNKYSIETYLFNIKLLNKMQVFKFESQAQVCLVTSDLMRKVEEFQQS